VCSAQLRAGYVTDLYSAFYPLTAVSPVLRSLQLHDHGLRWSHAPAVLAHPPRPDADTAAVLHRDPGDTAAGLAAEHTIDGKAWLELVEQWQRVRDRGDRERLGLHPPAPRNCRRRVGGPARPAGRGGDGTLRAGIRGQGAAANCAAPR
jgi:phytoene dehydrogenase-like protein